MNVNVKHGRGTHGEIVILSAYCDNCKQDVLPSETGRCNWCNSRVVDEDTLKAGDLLRGAAAVNGRDGRRRGPAGRYSFEEARAAVLRFAELHGHAPGWNDMGPKNGLPSAAVCMRLGGGSFVAFLEQCGLTPLRPGRPQRGSLTALDTGTPRVSEAPRPLSPPLLVDGLRLVIDLRSFLERLEGELRERSAA